MRIPSTFTIRSPLRVARALSVLVLAALLAAPSLRAQDESSVEVARQLMEDGNLEAASDSLRAQLRIDPQNGTAYWLLGRALYWMKRGPEALEQYKAAVSLQPADPWLRVEYAEVLLSLGERSRARSTLEDVLADRIPAAAEAEALALLGRLAYWGGDYNRAVRLFEGALERDPGHRAAQTELGEIRAATRPWFRMGAGVRDDNQPYRRYRGAIEAGAYIAPLWAFRLEAVPRVLQTNVDAAVGAVSVGVSGYMPSLRLELTGRLGAWLTRDYEVASAPWTAIGGLGLRLPAATTLRAEASRRRYLGTRASADTFVMVRTVDLRLDRAASPGWAGEGVARHESFPDGNVVRTAYAWLLAPLLPQLRLGYSVAWQNADESRWTASSGAVGDGYYDPYFTPDRVRTHAVLAELLLPLEPTAVRIDGSYGFHAAAGEPTSAIAGVGTPGRGPRFDGQHYSPWRLGAEVVLPVTAGVNLRLAGERERTTYYELTHVALAIRYTFTRSNVLP